MSFDSTYECRAVLTQLNGKPFSGTIEFDMTLEDLIGATNELVESTVAARLEEIVVSHPVFDLEHSIIALF